MLKYALSSNVKESEKKFWVCPFLSGSAPDQLGVHSGPRLIIIIIIVIIVIITPADNTWLNDGTVNVVSINDCTLNVLSVN